MTDRKPASSAERRGSSPEARRRAHLVGRLRGPGVGSSAPGPRRARRDACRRPAGDGGGGRRVSPRRRCRAGSAARGVRARPRGRVRARRPAEDGSGRHAVRRPRAGAAVRARRRLRARLGDRDGRVLVTAHRSRGTTGVGSSTVSRASTRSAPTRRLPTFSTPHVGTLVETRDDVGRILDGSEVRLCLDTGHFRIGGVDSVALACEAPQRVGHVHLKDVRESVAEARAGRIDLRDATRQGAVRAARRWRRRCRRRAGRPGRRLRGWYVLSRTP